MSPGESTPIERYDGTSGSLVYEERTTPRRKSAHGLGEGELGVVNQALYFGVIAGLGILTLFLLALAISKCRKPNKKGDLEPLPILGDQSTSKSQVEGNGYLDNE